MIGAITGRVVLQIVIQTAVQEYTRMVVRDGVLVTIGKKVITGR